MLYFKYHFHIKFYTVKSLRLIVSRIFSNKLIWRNVQTPKFPCYLVWKTSLRSFNEKFHSAIVKKSDLLNIILSGSQMTNFSGEFRIQNCWFITIFLNIYKLVTWHIILKAQNDHHKVCSDSNFMPFMLLFESFPVLKSSGNLAFCWYWKERDWRLDQQ